MIASPFFVLCNKKANYIEQFETGAEEMFQMAKAAKLKGSAVDLSSVRG